MPVFIHLEWSRYPVSGLNKPRFGGRHEKDIARCIHTVIFSFECMEPWFGRRTHYTLTHVSDNIQIIYGPFDLPDNKNRGFRNNVVIVSTSEGVVILDPGGSADAGERVARTVKEQIKLPVVAVFNSHAHGDHWLGNEGIKRHYPQAVIYGHPVMKTRVLGPDGNFWLDTINRLTGDTAKGKHVVAPDKTVNDGDEIKIGDTTFRIHHTGAAHTDSDIMIEVTGENALFTGDIVRNGLLGIMEEDASFKGNIAAIDFIVSKNFQYYIPGHGLVGDVATPQKSCIPRDPAQQGRRTLVRRHGRLRDETRCRKCRVGL